MGVWYECVGKYTNAQSGVGDVFVCVPCSYATVCIGASSDGRKKNQTGTVTCVSDMIFFLHLEADLSGSSVVGMVRCGADANPGIWLTFYVAKSTSICIFVIKSKWKSLFEISSSENCQSW